MTRSVLNIDAGRLFPFQFLILGAVFVFAGVIVMLNYPVGSAVLIFPGVVILTASEGTQIDMAARSVREYYRFLFFKFGNARKFQSIGGISIHKAKISQKMFTARTLSSSTFSHTEFHAYVWIDGEKMFLFGGKNKEHVLRRARQVADHVHTAVTDLAIAR